MTVQESCGFDCHPALYAGEHSMAAELSSTLPVHWNYLIHDASFQTRPYMDFWGNECAHWIWYLVVCDIVLFLCFVTV